MDQAQKELTFDESVAQVMQTLPPPIRQYLAQGKYSDVAKSLMTKYALRIDQSGVLEREIMLLLMGIETPEEFTQALTTEATLSQQVVSGIVQDVNTQIFIPLRQEMMRGAGSVQPTRPSIPAVAPMAPAAPTPGAAEPTHFHLQNKLAAPSRPPQPTATPIPPAPQPTRPPTPITPVQSQPAPFPQPPRPLNPAPAGSGDRSAKQNGLATQPTSLPVVVPARPIQPQPIVPPRPVSNIAPLPPKTILPGSFGNMRAMGTRPSVAPSVGRPHPMPALVQKPMESNRMLEDHEEPHIDIKNKVQEISPETPLQQALRTVLPRPAVASAVPVVASGEGRGVGGPPPPNLPGAMPPKPYSADPYREPIDEK